MGNLFTGQFCINLVLNFILFYNLARYAYDRMIEEGISKDFCDYSSEVVGTVIGAIIAFIMAYFCSFRVRIAGNEMSFTAMHWIAVVFSSISLLIHHSIVKSNGFPNGIKIQVRRWFIHYTFWICVNFYHMGVNTRTRSRFESMILVFIILTYGALMAPPPFNAIAIFVVGAALIAWITGSL